MDIKHQQEVEKARATRSPKHAYNDGNKRNVDICLLVYGEETQECQDHNETLKAKM